ncbi:MAG TPA: hypothetical protein VEA38_00855 [Terriglobales bacterium]|nr:hypothetical protein [Terriglobales bacterium]
MAAAERRPLASSERAEVLSMRLPKSLRLRFQQAAIAEGREHLTPFILECAIDGLESRMARAALEAYRRTTRNTATGGA